MSKFSEIFRKHINNGMTLRKKRFKHRKCMRQFFVFRKINNLMLFLCCYQSLLKTDRVISQMIVMASITSLSHISKSLWLVTSHAGASA